METPTPPQLTESFRYDCFISYRRSDGTAIAQWLRRHLIAYRLPKSFSSARPTKLSVYIDTVYERATNDFFEQNIVPALQASRFLLVVATPDANKDRTDGTLNWVGREVKEFLETPQRNNIIAVRAAGKWTDPLPGNLADSFPNLDIIDAREASNGLIRRMVDRLITPNEIFTLVASLYGIDQQKMPELRQEETRRSRRRITVTATLVIAILLSITSLSAYAWYQKIKTDEANQAVLARYLAWQSGVMAGNSAKRRDEALLLAIEAYRRDPSSVTSSAVHSLLDQTALPLKRLHHDARVNAVSFTPDGRYLASASEDGSLRVWDYATGQVISYLKLEKPATSLKFGPNADELTAVFRTIRRRAGRSAADPGFMASWRWSQNTVTARFEAPKPPYLMLFDAQQKSMAGVTTDGIWQPRQDSPSSLHRFAQQIHFPIKLSRSSKYLAAYVGNEVTVCDALSGKQLQSIVLEKDVRPKALAFSPDDTQLLIGQSDGWSTLWRWQTKTKILAHRGFSDPSSLEFSPDGKYVAEIDLSLAANMSIWLTKDASEVYSTSSDEELTGEIDLHSTFSDDSKVLIVNLGDSSLRVVGLQDEYGWALLQFTPQSRIHDFALHSNSKLLATADDDGWVTLWRLEGGGKEASFPDARMFELSSRDGRVALIGKSLRIVDHDFKPATECALDTSNANVVSFSASGALVALGQRDGKLAIVNLANPAAARWRSIDDEDKSTTVKPDNQNSEQSEENGSKILALTFSKDEKKCIVVRNDGVRDVDVESWNVTPRLNVELAPNITISPDSSHFASKEVEGPIHVYSFDSFREILSITSGSFNTATAFSPNGKFFAGWSTKETMTVWDLASQKPMLETSVESVSSSIAFDSTSTYIAVSDDEKVQLWNLNTKKRLDLVQDKNEIGVLSFHPSEPYLAVGYSDKKIRIWKVSPQPQIVSEIPQDEKFEFGSTPIQFTRDGKFLIRAQGYADGPSGEFVTALPWQQDDLIRLACERVVRKKLDIDVWNEYLKGQSYRQTCN